MRSKRTLLTKVTVMLSKIVAGCVVKVRIRQSRCQADRACQGGSDERLAYPPNPAVPGLDPASLTCPDTHKRAFSLAMNDTESGHPEGLCMPEPYVQLHPQLLLADVSASLQL